MAHRQFIPLRDGAAHSTSNNGASPAAIPGLQSPEAGAAPRPGEAGLARIRRRAASVLYGDGPTQSTARYEVHLDRKLERTLAMLIRLRELRRSVATG